MRASLSIEMLLRRSRLLVLALLCFGTASCFRGYDLSKVKCAKDSHCPKEYPTCGNGICIRGPLDAGRANDGKAADVPMMDGPRDVGGAGGRSASGGSGGFHSSAGGSGGMILGGETSTGGTATGGTDSSPDAPVGSSDGKLPKGASCAGDEECADGLCIDGFCCDGPCSGCSACSNEMTGEPNGTCAPVAIGSDPHETCADETSATPANPCGNDGNCDGKGGCGKVGENKECGPASCNGTVLTPASRCDGQGKCVSGTDKDCAPYECASTGCKQTCTTQEQCDTATSYCDTTNKVCATKKANGKPAGNGYECISKIVADGVCCDKECTGCYACTADLNGQAASTTGECRAVTAEKASDPHTLCPAESDRCGRNGTCNGAGGCRYGAEVGADCAMSCDAETSMLTRSTCSSSHVCTPLSPSACPGSKACGSASACKTGSCASDDDCAKNSFCLGGTCTAKYDNGHSCTGADNQCRSNTCVGNVCCATPCGECHACATGTCTTVSNGTACGTGVCNNGSCSACNAGISCTPSVPDECGKYATSCSTGVSQCVRTGAVDNGTLCGNAARCNGTQSIGHWTCQGGACTQPTPKTCQYTCDTSTGGCAGECSPNTSKCYSESQIQKCTSSYTYGAPEGCGTNRRCSNNQCVCADYTCGSSCLTCSSPTPYCVNGACAECSNYTQCPDGYMSCTGGKCGCKVPSSGNKIANPGFDGGSYAPWVLNGAVLVKTYDYDNCPGSGVIRVPDSVSPYSAALRQCFAIGGGVSYRFGFRFQGAANCSAIFYSQTGCNSSYMIPDSSEQFATDTTNPNWQDSEPIEKTTPATSASVSIECFQSVYAPGTSTYEQFYFNTGSGTF